MINSEQTSRAEIRLILSIAANTGIAMSIYQFVLRTHGAQVEHLGALPLRDDSEAVEFGRAVVRDMIRGTPRPQAASVVEVFSGARTVGCVRPAKTEAGSIKPRTVRDPTVSGR